MSVHTQRQPSRPCFPSAHILQPQTRLETSVHLPRRPALPLGSHLDGREPPVLAVVVATVDEARARHPLLLGQDGQNAKDDGHAGVELHAHQPLRDGVGDVLEVHRLALDQHADGDDGVERARGLRRGGQRRQVCRAAREEVAGTQSAGAGAEGRGLYLRGGVEP